ncbi:DNA-binding protein, partial [Streptomyces sp. FT05W]
MGCAGEREPAEAAHARPLRAPRRRGGLPPGLRREEVAQLSAVGVTWYTWLVQGGLQVSPQVLDSLARALR